MKMIQTNESVFINLAQVLSVFRFIPVGNFHKNKLMSHVTKREISPRMWPYALPVHRERVGAAKRNLVASEQQENLDS